MKRSVIILTLVMFSFGAATILAINCGDNWQTNGERTVQENCSFAPSTYTVTRPYMIFWVDTVLGRAVTVSATGQCKVNVFFTVDRCVPLAGEPGWYTNNARVG